MNNIEKKIQEKEMTLNSVNTEIAKRVETVNNLNEEIRQLEAQSIALQGAILGFKELLEDVSEKTEADTCENAEG